MISKKFQNKITSEEFHRIAHYFGVAIQISPSPTDHENPALIFKDLEVFFLSATLHLKTSRVTEGFLCWILEFGHLLSPSKVRRLIQAGQKFDPAILGGLIEFLTENKILQHQWKIVRPFCRKKPKAEQLLDGPIPRAPSSYFLKYRIIAPQFRLDTNKFLLPTSIVYKNCIELKNRALFGSVVNADVASYLQKNPDSTPYQIAVNTHHHKARVFEVYKDVRSAS